MSQPISGTFQPTLETYIQALDAITDMVSVIGEDEVYRVVNRAWCRVMGMSSDQVVGRHTDDVFAERSLHPDRRRALRACVEQGQPTRVQDSRLTRDGAPRVIESTYFPFGADQSGHRCVVVVSRDVTPQALALQAESAHRQELRALLEAFPGYIAMLDEHLDYSFVNARFCELVSRPAQEILGRNVDALLGPERGAEVRLLAARAMAEGAVVFEREQGGRLVQVTMAGSIDPLIGKPRYFGFGQDITARRRAEQALVAARNEAEQANQAKSRFLSHMSHELRTPLNAVLGFAQLLRTDTRSPLPEHQRAQLSEIEHGAQHLLDLINDVLDLGRIEAGKLPLQLQPVDVLPLLHECLTLVQPLARAMRVTVWPLTEAWARPACADPVRLKQVLLNLLANAIKFNHPGGSVSLTLAPSAASLRVEVHDTGDGLNESQLQRLFQPFERVHDESRGVQGTGIGLALCRQLMLAMQGQIGARSTPGQGSCFWLELPWTAPGVAGEPAADSPTTAASVAPAAPASAAGSVAPVAPAMSGKRRVLYIEDNAVNVVLMEAMLARLEGVELASELQPEAGLARAREWQPQLVLLDIQLPGMSGFEVLRQLRSDARTARIPVVAVSANAMPSDVATGLDAGFNAYLTKPLVLQQLLEVVQSTLQEAPAPGPVNPDPP